MRSTQDMAFLPALSMTPVASAWHPRSLCLNTARSSSHGSSRRVANHFLTILAKAAAVRPTTSSPVLDNVISSDCTYVITILSEHASASPALLASVAADTVARANGKIIKDIRPLGPHAFGLHALLPDETNISQIRQELFEQGTKLTADLNIQSGQQWSPKKLAVFDLDSTLIAQETIDEMAVEAGVADQVREITRRAMNGEMNFREALSERVALLKGLHVDSLELVKSRVRITPGARKLTSALRKMNCETAVVSGGFQFLANHIRDELQLDHAYANQLEIGPDSRLTGRTLGYTVDGEFKADTLKRLAEARGLAKDEILAVGDGSNDIPMMKLAGVGVAFNAKPIVQENATTRVNHDSLATILYLLGLSDIEIEQLSD